jgi:general secretion pathway protein G
MLNNIRKALHNEKGFTLVEMMVVLIIIAVLIGLGIRVYIGYIGSAKLTKASGDITTVEAALDGYYATNNAYPNSTTSATAVTLQAALTAAGISSGEVDADTASTDTQPYVYTCAAAAGPYTVCTRTPVNKQNMQGTGTLGVSEQAKAISAT